MTPPLRLCLLTSPALPCTARPALQQLMPRLWTLADQETKWLEEGGQQGAAAKGADVARDAATTAAVAAAAAASGGVGGSSSGAEASEGKEAEAAVDALGNVLDGNTEMVGDEESSPSSSEAAEGGEEPQQQREQQRKEQPQVQPPVPAEAEGQDGIDSPWAQVRLTAALALLRPACCLCCGPLQPRPACRCPFCLCLCASVFRSAAGWRPKLQAWRHPRLPTPSISYLRSCLTSVLSLLLPAATAGDC